MFYFRTSSFNFLLGVSNFGGIFQNLEQNNNLNKTKISYPLSKKIRHKYWLGNAAKKMFNLEGVQDRGRKIHGKVLQRTRAGQKAFNLAGVQDRGCSSWESLLYFDVYAFGLTAYKILMPNIFMTRTLYETCGSFNLIWSIRIRLNNFF